jgi:hypothetical protein
MPTHGRLSICSSAILTRFEVCSVPSIASLIFRSSGTWPFNHHFPMFSFQGTVKHPTFSAAIQDTLWNSRMQTFKHLPLQLPKDPLTHKMSPSKRILQALGLSGSRESQTHRQFKSTSAFHFPIALFYYASISSSASSPVLKPQRPLV